MSDLYLGEFSTDVTPPEVTNPSPAPPYIYFPRDWDVEFDITDAEAGVDLASLVITIAGATAYDWDGLGGDPLAGFQPGYGGTITDTGGGTYHVDVTTHPDFDSFSSVTVTVDAQDLAPLPNVMAQYSWTFTVEDYEPPYVDTGFYPPDLPAGVDIPIAALVTFDLKDDGSGVDLSTVVVTVGGVVAYSGSLGGFQAGFDGLSSAVDDSLAPQQYGFVIDASPDFDEFTTYEVIVNADDLALNGPILAASFDDGANLYEGFESSPNRDIPFTLGGSVAATFDDDTTPAEDFESWGD